ncbi:hypothetical protein TRFO_26103 [Tritrichomonas foetus]|uniref:Uncharacterized protein n=1 Tax=Tritrichomonas foetus TaxID=1144522 RepID=A0A1J4K8C5_9EUKA|nr:hypothetical protein TRFO_26103 [Tritrichomonas foetus]|eukprot:OHT05964.1 hypothetical protein TRFO_26103 [Tritrichomonas foetus]
MANTMREKVGHFAEIFNYDTNIKPQSITKKELLEFCLFLDSMPNEFSYSVSGRNLDDLISVYEEFRNHIISDDLLHAEFESCLFPFFCYLFLQYKKDGNQEYIEKVKSQLLPTIPPQFQDEANKFVNDDNFYQEFAPIISTQKFICKCSRSSARKFSDYLNKPENSQIRSLITSIIVLEDKDCSRPKKSYFLKFLKKAQKNGENLNILKTEVTNATLATCSPRMSSLFLVKNEQDLYELNIIQQKTKKVFIHAGTITTLSASSKSSVVFSGDIYGNAHLWSHSASVILPQVTTTVWSSCFSPSGGVFIFGCEDKIIRLYDTPNHQPARYFVGHNEAVTDVLFHHNCSLIGSCSIDNTVRLWDIREAKTVRLFISETPKAFAPAFSWDGKLIAFLDKDLVVCELSTSKTLMRIPLSNISYIQSIYFSTDNQHIFIVSQKGTIVAINITADAINNVEKPIIDLHSNIIASNMSITNDLFTVTSKCIDWVNDLQHTDI